MKVLDSNQQNGVLQSVLHCSPGMWSAHSTTKLTDLKLRNLQTEVAMFFTRFCVCPLILHQDEMNKFMSEHKTVSQLCTTTAPQTPRCLGMGVAQLGFESGCCLF